MGPYWALGRTKSAVLFSSRSRFLRPDHGELGCWLDGAVVEGVPSVRLVYK